MPQQLLALAAAAEARVQHPAAEALLTHARELGGTPGEHTHARWEVGLGVEAEVDGWRLHLGNERFLREQAIDCSAAHADLARLHHRAQSSLLLAVGGRLAGLIAYADAVRPEMRSVLAALQRRGVHHAVMLTGDNHTVARAVGGELGFARFAAEMMPDEKARIVSTLRERGHVVAMVGDGINDSAAL